MGQDCYWIFFSVEPTLPILRSAPQVSRACEYDVRMTIDLTQRAVAAFSGSEPIAFAIRARR